MLRFVAVVAIVGAVFLLERGRGSVLEVSGQYGNGDPGWQAESAHAWLYAPCRAADAGRQLVVEDVMHPAVSTLPNSYVNVNGRLFTLGDIFACSSRLHTARVN